MTNFEKIKELEMKDLAELISEIASCVHCPLYSNCDACAYGKCKSFIKCRENILNWLKAEEKYND